MPKNKPYICEAIPKPTELVSTLSKTYLYREKQIMSLLSALGLPGQSPWSCVYVYGHSSTGKSSVLHSLISELGYVSVSVNLSECHSSRTLYELVLHPLYGEHVPCANMNEFILKLASKLPETGKTFCLVLEKAERLRDMETHVMPSLLRLSELVNSVPDTLCDVCVVLESTLVWEKCVSLTCYTIPYIVHFTEYSKSQLEQLVCKDLERGFGSSYSSSLYVSYTSMYLGVMRRLCQDLRELCYHANINFRVFVKPIDDGELREKDVVSLWKRVLPCLRDTVNSVFMRESRYGAQRACDDQRSVDVAISDDDQREYVELPFYSKFLLVAAYLASYNPQKCDKHYFVKLSTKSRKKRVTKKKPVKLDKNNRHITGPKVFPISRLLAIFYTITEMKTKYATIHILSQITTLINLRLLQKVSCEYEISDPRYRCTASLSYVKNVAKTVNFNVLMYLYDFQS